jgi:hypothetical protein
MREVEGVMNGVTESRNRVTAFIANFVDQQVSSLSSAQVSPYVCSECAI